MKNNRILLILLLFFTFFENTYGEDFIFEASNLTFEDNSKIVYGTNGIKIILEKNTEILANDFIYNKNTNILKISNNVKITNKQEKIVIKGDEFIYYKNENRIISEKKINAEIHDEYFLEANYLDYDLANKILASNKPSKIIDTQNNQLLLKDFIFLLKEKLLTSNKLHFIDYTDNNYFLEKIKINTSTKNILGKDLEVNFDNSTFGNSNNNPRLKGNSVEIGNNKTIISKGIFTTCKKNNKCPPWTLQSEKIIHNKTKKTITYDNALLRFYNLPIMYFPKFFHPDPTVKRQSGFLIPKFATGNILGSTLEIPYFKAISNNKDFTVKPIYSSKKGLLLNTEYREARKNSKHIVDFSVTNETLLNTSSNSKKYKNYFFSNSLFNLNLDSYISSSLELDIQKVSSDQYLKSYNFNTPLITSDTTLNSKIDFNGFKDNSSLNISAEIFEDLSKNKNDRYEFILPHYNFTKIINIQNKLLSSMDINSTGSYRNYETNKSEQLVVNDFILNSKTFFSEFGIESNYYLNFKNLNYNTKSSKKFKRKKDSDLFSSILLNYSYPLIKTDDTIKSFFSPKLSLRYSPNNSINLQDEDKNISVENIYSYDRMNLSESIESGKSLTLGFDYSLEDNDQNEIIEFDVAQVFRDVKNYDLPNTNNIGEKNSDVIGSLTFKPINFLELQYKFSADNNLKNSNYDYIKSDLNFNNFITSFEFLEETDNFGNNGFWKNTSKYLFDENNSISFEKRRNTKKDIDEYFNLIYAYENDCLIASVKYNKSFYKDGDLQPNDEIFFSIAIIPFSETTTPNLK
jgi:LPS-assembly protein